jgi:hypothetical protein
MGEQYRLDGKQARGRPSPSRPRNLYIRADTIMPRCPAGHDPLPGSRIKDAFQAPATPAMPRR